MYQIQNGSVVVGNPDTPGLGTRDLFPEWVFLKDRTGYVLYRLLGIRQGKVRVQDKEGRNFEKDISRVWGCIEGELTAKTVKKKKIVNFFVPVNSANVVGKPGAKVFEDKRFQGLVLAETNESYLVRLTNHCSPRFEGDIMEIEKSKILL